MYKKKSKMPILIILGGIFLFFLIGGIISWNYLQSPLDRSGEIKAFVVQKGEGTGSIADRLESEGFIRSALAFKLFLQLTGQKGLIEAGDFKISSNMSMGEIVKVLSEGSIDKWVTLIEGWRIEQIADELNQKLGIDKVKFLEAAEEGYMFPDTYLFNPESSPEDIATILKDNFEKKYTPDMQSKIKQKGLTPKDGLILASLVEREGRSEKVRTEVAGVLLNRLRIGMKLDVDSTVQYAKDTQTLNTTGKIDKYWKPISKADYTKVVSPYNTYLNNGLPPEPICNPSLASLNAVANAEASPYLYYYHDSSGNSHYSKTIEEHQEKIATYP